MKIKNIKDVIPVKFTGGESFRTVLDADNFGFALMETKVKKGGPYKWHYLFHKEVCHCISGRGILKCLTTNKEFNIKKGTTYMLDKNEPHEFIAITNVVLVSVFNPPLKGNEKHDKNGVYPRPNRINYLEDIYNVVKESSCKIDAIETLENIL
jgi:L-ectoine synthase